MPLVTRDARNGGGSTMLTPLVIVVCVASVVTASALGVLAWRLIIWKRNRSSPPTSTSTKLLLSPTTIVFPASPPPAYSPGLMKTSPTSSKKSTLALSLDVNCDVEATEPSPIRSASFNPSTKTQSISSRVSSRMSVGAKKLPRLMTVTVLYVPSLSDELPIRLGETIRMIEEYEDEWCLVQRVGRTDERGVIPRFCLTERQEIIPRSGKRTISGLFQTSTFRK